LTIVGKKKRKEKSLIRSRSLDVYDDVWGLEERKDWVSLSFIGSALGSSTESMRGGRELEKKNARPVKELLTKRAGGCQIQNLPVCDLPTIRTGSCKKKQSE